MTNTATLSQTFCFKVQSDLNAIATVADWFEQFNRLPITPRLWQEGQIALIEGFTNAVRHAHQHLDASTVIDIEVKISSEALQIWIWDWGDAYDIEIAFAQLTQLMGCPDFDPLEREAQWGSILLLKLRNEYGWQIFYQHQEGKNCLRLEKSLDPHQGS